MLIGGLYSKRPELNGFPRFGMMATGVIIDGLLDMSYMGIGACPLGYCNDKVNAAVKKVIDNGNMHTFNGWEDADLDELLMYLHPWAKYSRFTRTGGEAMAVAFRIAQAATGTTIPAVNGYHGWHLTHYDKAVPGRFWRFTINDAQSVRDIPDDVKIIIIEPIRNELPTKEYLEALKVARKGRILISDEVTTGFRFVVGPYSVEQGLDPDMVVYGKGISNGYAMGAIVGNDVMEASEKTFISSTYFTERIGPAAALATIKELWGKSHHDLLTAGRAFIRVLNKHGVKHNGIDALIEYESLPGFSEFMLKKRIIACNKFYPSAAHSAIHFQLFDEALTKYEEGRSE